MKTEGEAAQPFCTSRGGNLNKKPSLPEVVDLLGRKITPCPLPGNSFAGCTS
jgi:hypothetical protein